MGMSAHACQVGEHEILLPGAHLLVFRYVEGSHSGDNIGTIVFQIIDEAGLRHKVCVPQFRSSTNSVMRLLTYLITGRHDHIGQCAKQ